ncbi:MAG: TrkH family potassium uptake protein [Ruminococcaceae bacterium]|nr:TrkH family potassium uptake protein [Oscillospiraceae bacterium]
MNLRMIKYTLGWLLVFEAAFFVVPMLTALVYLESAGLGFLWSALICLALGGLLVLKKPKKSTIYAKEGFVIVALSWIVMSIFGSLPFLFTGVTDSFVDALFETSSGFTTTGASIFRTVEDLPKCILMWRSFTHWVGGMGVLVFIMAFLPLGGGQNMHIMRAESPGPEVSKLVPKVKHTALILYSIYFALTVLQFIILLFSGMSAFDAINTAFSTAGTGGFGIRNDSFSSFSAVQQIIVTVFMLVFSINFNSYYLALRLKFREAFNNEVRTFLLVVAVSIGIVAFNIYGVYGTVGEALRHAAFNVASLISTTGFTTANFDLWPSLAKTVLVLVMFIGACAGSTGGGMKVSRLVIAFKGFAREINTLVHPKQVKKITIDKRAVDGEVIRSVNSYLACYILVFALSLLLITIDGRDLVTNFTAVAATLNNVGPGLAGVGPVSNFADFSVFSKLVLIFDMIAGRLELFPMLVLLSPAAWKKA